MKVASNKINSRKGLKQMPLEFVPNDDDILCGRGNNVYYHPGNHKLRRIIQNIITDHHHCPTHSKATKSHLIYTVLAHLRSDHPLGARFIKQDLDSGCYFELDAKAVVRFPTFTFFSASVCCRCMIFCANESVDICIFDNIVQQLTIWF
jgi:hypothetical protein